VALRVAPACSVGPMPPCERSTRSGTRQTSSSSWMRTTLRELPEDPGSGSLKRPTSTGWSSTGSRRTGPRSRWKAFRGSRHPAPSFARQCSRRGATCTSGPKTPQTTTTHRPWPRMSGPGLMGCPTPDRLRSSRALVRMLTCWHAARGRAANCKPRFFRVFKGCPWVT
jgi:hypothetical protein